MSTTTTTTTTAPLFDVIDTLPEPSAAAIEFFYEHAGYGYDPLTETPEQGRRRGAVALAKSEHWVAVAGHEFTWSDDQDGDHSYTLQDESDGYEVTTCERVELRRSGGECLAALGCIDDATDEYRRVIEAGLALEALPDMDPEV